jgi:hypothetical protein
MQDELVDALLQRHPFNDARAMVPLDDRPHRLDEAADPAADQGHLLNDILGVGGQNAANVRALEPGKDRTAFPDTVSAVWADLDPDQYQFSRSVAGQLCEHDDREQFLAGSTGLWRTATGPPR